MMGLRLPVSIVLDNVRSMYNVGAFFRTADGAGIERLLVERDYRAAADECDYEDGAGSRRTRGVGRRLRI